MSWQEWDYAEWNMRLLRHSFGAPRLAGNEPVERIPATPEELVLVAEGAVEEAQSIHDAFLANIRLQVPAGGKSFCGFCYDYKGWDVESQDRPPFFAMLWLTCLAAYGVPEPALSFARRMWLLLGKSDNLQSRALGGEQPICLPKLWEDLQSWLRHQHARGEPYRELLLPSELGIRTGIGHSWFLAFPHREDRGCLAKVLWDAGVIGFEPPVHRVLEILDSHRSTFSKGLKEDLKDFKAAYAGGLVSARASAFWRAVRQEALSPFLTREEERRERGARVELLIVDTEDGLRPLVCGPPGWKVPPNYVAHPLDEPTGVLASFLRGKDGSLDEPVEDAFLYGNLLSLAHRKLVDQGIVLLRELSSELYRIVSGSEANGVTLALVRNDLLVAFLAAFGGVRHEGLIEGWSSVVSCSVRVSETLPSGLSHALQLLPTMFPPVITSSGGIRLPGGFLRALHFLPHLHADGAEIVFIKTEAGGEHPCLPVHHEGATEWALPPAHVPRVGEVVAWAKWPSGTAQEAQEASTLLRFEDETFQNAFKPLGAAVFGAEACLKPEVNVNGGAEVELGITTADSALSADLFSLESQVRWLGPGLGEMSLTRSSGFDWLAVGSLKKPELLVYVGDPNAPRLPAQTQSESKGNRRHWKNAFTKARRKFVEVGDGSYRPILDFPPVADALAAYGRHMNLGPGAGVCPSIDPRDLQERQDGLVPADSATEEAVEAIAALSVRRSGLSRKETAEVLTGLLPKPAQGEREDHLSVQQVLRSWTECGQLDLLRDVRSGHLAIVARRPRLVLVRRGPGVEARVIGLLSRVHRQRLESVCGSQGVSLSEAEAPNRWQPSILRLRGTAEEVDAVASKCGLEPSQWLHWPSIAKVAPHFDVSSAYGRLDSTPPAPSYRAQLAWDWEKMKFTRAALKSGATEGVVVERRLHPDGSSVHVVLDDSKVVAWSYLRNWALLFAHDLRGVRPFVRRPDGTLACRGASPVHLPLPIARLCALTGVGLPGPRFDEKSGRVTAYEYPFGRKLSSLLEPVIPPSWVSSDT